MTEPYFVRDMLSELGLASIEQGLSYADLGLGFSELFACDAQAMKPGFDIVGCSVYSIAEVRETFEYLSIRTERFDIVHAATKSAATVCAEWDYRFFAEIVFLKQGKHEHGHGAPPVGVAEEDCVVLRQGGEICGKFGASLVLLFLFCFLGQSIVVLCVGTHCFQFYHVAAHAFMNHDGEFACVA